MTYLGVFGSKPNEYKMACGVHLRCISSAKGRSSQAHLNQYSRIREGCPKGHRLIAKPDVSRVSITLLVIVANQAAVASVAFLDMKVGVKRRWSVSTGSAERVPARSRNV